MTLSPRAIKLLTKGVLMLASSAVIGTVIKAEEQLKDRLEERYAKKDPEETDNSED